jgi:hypothetical protein
VAARSRKGKSAKHNPKVRGRSLGRKKPLRAVGRTVLIVCEDSKSSPEYFEKLRSKLRLKTVNVEVCGKECGAAPISVVDYAIAKKEEVKTSSIRDGYDDIFCVIDIDNHETLDRAIQKAKDNKLEIIISNPCFEYWYILHFEKTGKSYSSRPKLYSKLSAHLKKHGYKPYKKSGCDFFDIIYPLRETAIENSKGILHSQYHNETDLRKCDPATHVHLVVGCMMDMAK